MGTEKTKTITKRYSSSDPELQKTLAQIWCDLFERNPLKLSPEAVQREYNKKYVREGYKDITTLVRTILRKHIRKDVHVHYTGGQTGVTINESLGNALSQRWKNVVKNGFVVVDFGDMRLASKAERYRAMARTVAPFIVEQLNHYYKTADEVRVGLGAGETIFHVANCLVERKDEIRIDRSSSCFPLTGSIYTAKAQEKYLNAKVPPADNTVFDADLNIRLFQRIASSIKADPIGPISRANNKNLGNTWIKKAEDRLDAFRDSGYRSKTLRKSLQREVPHFNLMGCGVFGTAENSDAAAQHKLLQIATSKSFVDGIDSRNAPIVEPLQALAAKVDIVETHLKGLLKRKFNVCYDLANRLTIPDIRQQLPSDRLDSDLHLMLVDCAQKMTTANSGLLTVNKSTLRYASQNTLVTFGRDKAILCRDLLSRGLVTYDRFYLCSDLAIAILTELDLKGETN